MTSKNDTMIYLKMSVKGILRRPGFRIPYYSMKYYFSWRRHHAPGRNSVDDQMPWMAFSAIDFLDKIAHSDMDVFEYGSGGSTLFWSSRVRQVISVEHDRQWFDRMQKELDRLQIRNVKYLLREAKEDPEYPKKDFRNPEDFLSSDKDYSGKNFEDYVRTIDSHPDSAFDIIAVDGRARPSCIHHALKKLKKRGYLIIDNSERKYYLAPFTFNKKDWDILTFGGPVPYVSHHSDTTVMRKK